MFRENTGGTKIQVGGVPIFRFFSEDFYRYAVNRYDHC